MNKSDNSRRSNKGHLAKFLYSATERFSVDFFALSAAPRLRVERVMGCSAAPFSGSYALEPPFFSLLSSLRAQLSRLTFQQAPAKKPKRSML